MSYKGNQEIRNEQLLFAVYDAKSETFSALIPSPNVEVVKRQLKAQISTQPNSLFLQYPADFSLYQIGHWCSLTGFMYGDLNFVCELSEILSEGGEI